MRCRHIRRSPQERGGLLIEYDVGVVGREVECHRAWQVVGLGEAGAEYVGEDLEHHLVARPVRRQGGERVHRHPHVQAGGSRGTFDQDHAGIPGDLPGHFVHVLGAVEVERHQAGDLDHRIVGPLGDGTGGRHVPEGPLCPGVGRRPGLVAADFLRADAADLTLEYAHGLADADVACGIVMGEKVSGRGAAQGGV